MSPLSAKLVDFLGWLLLALGVLLYIVPLFYELLGFHSGLVAFGLIFIGISLLKYRKDQINNKSD
jgi:heme/copper-type cytochrome/quinol oxidase subunit 3